MGVYKRLHSIKCQHFSVMGSEGLEIIIASTSYPSSAQPTAAFSFNHRLNIVTF